MFENVTYDFYKNTLGCTVITDEDTFNSYKLQNVQYMKRLLPYVEELEENGIDSAVCLMIERDYKADIVVSQSGTVLSSESVSGHSASFDNTARNKAIELNTKSIDAQKIDVIKLFCSLNVGVV